MSWSNIQNAFSDDEALTGSSVSASFANPIAAGSIVSGMVEWENDFPGPSLLNVTDDKGNSTYVINVDAFSDATNGEAFSSFYAVSFPNGLPTTIIANFSGSSAFFAINVKEDSPGASMTVSLDGHAGQLQTLGFNATTTNGLSSGSATTTANGDLINGFTIHSGGDPIFTAGTSPNAFTSRVLSHAGSGKFSIASEDFIQTTAGNIAATFGQSNGSSGNTACGVLMLAFKAVSAAGATVFAPQSFFETTKLKRPSEFSQSPIKPFISPVVEQSFFDTVKLKKPVIDNAPILLQPAAIAVANIVEQPFFDTVKLKRPSEFGQGPFAGTSPPISSVYVTQAFFDQVKLKQPIIDKPADVAPLVLVVTLSASNWFDAVKLMKVPERFGELYPQQYWTPETFDKWFDQVKLLKVPERLQEAFGAPFPPRQSLTAWFDEVQKLKVPGDFPFTASGVAQPATIQNALTDWFPMVKLKQPIIDPALVVYFPAQQIIVVQEHHDLPFFATPGQLMTR